jgi:hypothetical protein
MMHALHLLTPNCPQESHFRQSRDKYAQGETGGNGWTHNEISWIKSTKVSGHHRDVMHSSVRFPLLLISSPHTRPGGTEPKGLRPTESIAAAMMREAQTARKQSSAVPQQEAAPSSGSIS